MSFFEPRDIILSGIPLERFHKIFIAAYLDFTYFVKDDEIIITQDTRSCLRIPPGPIGTSTGSLQKPAPFPLKSGRIRQGFRRNLCFRNPGRKSKENDPVVSCRIIQPNIAETDRSRQPDDTGFTRFSPHISPDSIRFRSQRPHKESLVKALFNHKIDQLYSSENAPHLTRLRPLTDQT